MRLTVVGCSGSLPGPDSAASCYLVEAARGGRTWRVLLDLGSGALGPLQRHIALTDIDAVLLSHLHPDHCLDLCGLYVALKYLPGAGPRRPVPVYGPAGTARRMAAAYGLSPEPGMTPELDFRTWRDGVPQDIGPLRVTPFAVRHPVEAYGMRVEHEGGVLAYTGDTDTCGELTTLARDADLLLCEAAFTEKQQDGERGIHLTGRQAGEVASAARARRLVITHVPPWNDHLAAAAEARTAYAGPVELATSGASWQVRPALGSPDG